jgi:hypothetical protein
MSKFVWNGTRFVPIHQRIAFVTFANGRYAGHDAKLRQSVQTHCLEADVFTFHSFDEIQSPIHSQNPYAFKVYAIEAVRALGYEVIFWSDSINRLAKSIGPIIARTKEVGVYLPADGWKVGEWANDKSLAYFGVSRDDAMNIECCYACVLGFDFRNPITKEFFRLWKSACQDGIFCGMWDNTNNTESQDNRCKGHRHDQTCADLIAYKLGIPKSEPLLGEKSKKYFTSFRYP